MNKDDIMLCLDASSKNVGWTLAQGTRYITGGTQQFKSKVPGARIRAICFWTKRMVELYSPDVVGIEEPISRNGPMHNAKGDKLLARVAGAIEAVSLIFGVEQIVYIHPSTVKSTNLHKKNLAVAAAYVGKQSVGPDEADSIGVWAATLNELYG